MQLPGLERLALVPTASKNRYTSSEDSSADVQIAYREIFETEQADTAAAAEIPVRGDWNHVPEVEKMAYLQKKARVGAFVSPPTRVLERIDEGLRYRGEASLDPMTRLHLGEWLQGYFVDSHHHLHSPQLSSVHVDAYVAFWNKYLVPLANETDIQTVTGFIKDDIDNLTTAIGNLKPEAR